MHLSHHLAAVNLYSDLADAKVSGDLLVEATRYDHGHHLALTWGESIIARPEGRNGFFIFEPNAIPIQAKLDRVQEVLIPEWLGEEFYRSALHGLDRHWNIAVAGDEDDWQLNLRLRKLSLEI